MFCGTCGSEVQASDRFCPKCGGVVTAATAMATAAPGSAPAPVMGMPGYSAPAGYAPAGVVGRQYAGFWLRFLAIIIDGVILAVPIWILEAIFFAIFGLGSIASLSRLGPNPDPTAAVAALSGMIGGILMICFVAFFLHWLYFSLMESSAKQATLGKMVLSLKVTDLNGQRLTFGRATGRYFSKIISALIMYVGFIMAGFTEKKQALHDMIAGTLVWKNQ